MHSKKKRWSGPLARKRGQLTLFIIIGMILLAAFGAVLYLTVKAKTEPLKQQFEATLGADQKRILEGYVRGCAKSAFEEAVEVIGKQGGYYLGDQPGASFVRTQDIGNEKVTILLFCAGRDPSGNCNKLVGNIAFLDYIENKIEAYTLEKTKQCTNFDQLLKDPQFKNYAVDVGEIKVNLIIGESSVIANFDYPLQAKIGQQPGESIMSKFSVPLNVRLKSIHEAVEYMIIKYSEPSAGINYDPAQDFTENKRLDRAEIIVTKGDSSVELVTIKDLASQINNAPYILRFYVKK